ncbi:hypothetical protein LT493_26400 [Streptomyces tricolor]|nr:hypothetical protein [Streptomyces tricolor]
MRLLNLREVLNRVSRPAQRGRYPVGDVSGGPGNPRVLRSPTVQAEIVIGCTQPAALEYAALRR